jgi:hypothetical protein
MSLKIHYRVFDDSVYPICGRANAYSETSPNDVSCRDCLKRMDQHLQDAKDSITNAHNLTRKTSQ